MRVLRRFRLLLRMLTSPRKFLPLLLSSLLGLFVGAFFFSGMRNSTTYYRRMVVADAEHEHLNAKNLLLVGVMTAQRFLDSRALEIWRTWAQHVPGRVIFFVAQDTHISQSVSRSGMEIIILRGVDDSYPPQKKSFVMLRWMYDNHLLNFHWFMRADDDLYVRSDRLKNLLLSLDPNKAHLLGQAGLGNLLEYGQLSLGAEDNYCMGGPGIIMSRETLRQLAQHLESCLGHLLTTHEDVELGRCIRRHVGVACPWNYEMQTLFHNNASIAALYAGSLPLPNSFPLRRFITLHPVKQPLAMRRIHLHIEMLRLEEIRQKRMDLVEKLEELTRLRKGQNLAKQHMDMENQLAQYGDSNVALNEVSEANFSGLIPRVPNTTREVPIWEFISADFKLLFCAQRTNCPRHTLEADWRRTLSAVIINLLEQSNGNALQRGRILQFHSLQYGYTRLQPEFGVDIILDMALWYRRLRGTNRTPLTVRQHAYIQQRFGPIQARMLAGNFHRKEPIIYLVVALKSRANTFHRFLQNLDEISGNDNRHGIELVLVYYSTSEDTFINQSIINLTQHFPCRLLQMPNDRPFNRGEALSAGAALLPRDALIFFADVDVLIRADAFDRIRLNTLKGSQVYFPIVFSEFSPHTWETPSNDRNQNSIHYENNANHFVFNQRRGYFRYFGYGLVSIYHTDFESAGGFNLTIQGWGLEDVDFLERIVKMKDLKIFRAPDPGLVHVFHPINCTDNGQSKAQRDACEGTKSQSMASLDFLVQQFGPNL